MLHRREWLRRGIAAGGSLVAASPVRPQSPPADRAPPRIIDAHCHAGKGLNFGKGDPRSAPWGPRGILTTASWADAVSSLTCPRGPCKGWSWLALRCSRPFWLRRSSAAIIELGAVEEMPR